MGSGVLGLIFDAVRLAEYGYRFAAAGEEIEAYCQLLEGTSALLSHIRASRTKLSTHLTAEANKHIDEEILRTEPALDRARQVISRSRSVGSRGRHLRWVLKHKDAAQTHKDVLAQRHAALVGINLELAIASQKRPTYAQQPSSLDLLAMRHTGDQVIEAEAHSCSLAPRKSIHPTHKPSPIYTQRTPSDRLHLSQTTTSRARVHLRIHSQRNSTPPHPNSLGQRQSTGPALRSTHLHQTRPNLQKGDLRLSSASGYPRSTDLTRAIE